jgi:hypothetical protein
MAVPVRVCTIRFQNSGRSGAEDDLRAVSRPTSAFVSTVARVIRRLTDGRFRRRDSHVF